MPELRLIVRSLGLLLALPLASGCAVTSHTSQRSTLGTPATGEQLISAMNEPGPVVFESVVSADWAVDRGGLINLDHPKAQEAGLEDGDEAIQISIQVIRHPEHGTFIVDTGVEQAWVDEDGDPAVGWLVKSFLNVDALKVKQSAAAWLASESAPLAGIFLTHLHIDHVMGMPDLPKTTPIYSGPGETDYSGKEGLVLSFDDLLEGFAPFQVWPFETVEGAPFEGIVDIFGDGSVFALWVPGHTAGSTAFLVRSTEGPVLVLGDACHTAWGWKNGVEPGGFSYDQPRSAESLAKLKAFAEAHPSVRVIPGHQPLE